MAIALRPREQTLVGLGAIVGVLVIGWMGIGEIGIGPQINKVMNTKTK
jgi:hypothetical protein